VFAGVENSSSTGFTIRIDAPAEKDLRFNWVALYVKDADNLEWALSLKEQLDIGNSRASGWIEHAIKRLKTDIAKQLALEILCTDSNDWWQVNTTSEWWINRNKK
jgi:putative hydrolase of HD superfamily